MGLESLSTQISKSSGTRYRLVTPMAVHISNLPPQLLTLICCFCDTADLTNLATASRALSSAALQKLWHTLPSFSTFIYTLPSDAWTYSDAEGANLKWYLCESRTFVSANAVITVAYNS